jgi:hypothetical protein
MSSTIVNAAPTLISRGIQDLSTVAQAAVAQALPTHLPLIYLYTQKGPGTPGDVQPMLVSGADRTNIFGDVSFDERSKYANSATVLSNRMAARGNAQMIARIVPADVGPRANFALYIDLLPVESMPQYRRDATTGAIMYNQLGDPQAADAQAVATFSGYKAKWVVERITNLVDETKFGTLTTKPGDQTGTLSAGGSVQSTRIPILQFWASSYGEAGNNSAISLWAPTTAGTSPIDLKAMTDTGAYPFRLQVRRRADAKSTPVAVDTLDGDKSIDFVLKPNTIYTTYNLPYSLDERFLKKYVNTDLSQGDLNYGDFGGVYIYATNVAQVLSQIYTAEAAYVTATAAAGVALPVTKDFTVGAADQQWFMNLFTGTNSAGEPYYAYQVDSAATGATRLSETTNIFGGGGADGTLAWSDYSAAVSADIANFSVPTHKYMDDVLYPVSAFYDVGFPLDVKRSLCKFISERKDTAVFLTTAEFGGAVQTGEQERSVATVLRSFALAYPESDYYGTGTCRAFIISQTGDMVSSLLRTRLPLTIQLADRAARMMGAANGVWKRSELFDSGENNIIDLFTNVNNTSVPTVIRNKNWAIGMNWAQSWSMTQAFWPALKSVYDNDTSVLNSFFVVMGAIEMQKVGQRVWRRFTGSVRYTDNVLVETVNQAVYNDTVGRFADLFRITPNAVITAGDQARGYSWTLGIDLEANGMKTVMMLDVRARRMAAAA